MKKNYEMLLEEAKKVSQNSYSPYSNFPVGAALLTKDNKKFMKTTIIPVDDLDLWYEV